MKLSPNTRYAIRLLFELGGRKEHMSAACLAESTGMSLRTVENIHAVLRQHNITVGTVGAKGGIRLLVPLSEISLGEIVRLFDDGVSFAVCCGEKSNDCPNQDSCGIRRVWRMVSDLTQKHLDSISLAAILNQYPQNSEGPLLNIFSDNKKINNSR